MRSSDHERRYALGISTTALLLGPLAFAGCSVESTPPQSEFEQTAETAFDTQGMRAADAIAAYLNTHESTIRHDDDIWTLASGGDTKKYVYATYNTTTNELTVSATREPDTSSEKYATIAIVLTPGGEIAAQLADAQHSNTAPNTSVFTDPIKATGDNKAIVKSFMGAVPYRDTEAGGTGFIAGRYKKDSTTVQGAIVHDSLGVPYNQRQLGPYDKDLAQRVGQKIDEALEKTLG